MLGGLILSSWWFGTAELCCSIILGLQCFEMVSDSIFISYLLFEENFVH